VEKCAPRIFPHNHINPASAAGASKRESWEADIYYEKVEYAKEWWCAGTVYEGRGATNYLLICSGADEVGRETNEILNYLSASILRHRLVLAPILSE